MKIKDTFVVLSLYNNDWSWLKDYTKNYIVYNAGEPQEGTIPVPHVGFEAYAYLKYITENYENLPKTVMFIKSSIFKKCISQEDFDKVCNNKTFTPLLKQDHKTDGKINYYKDGLYYEKNDSWYFNHPDRWKHQHFHSYKEFADKMGLPCPEYLGFAPGACYIVPRKNILKRSKEFYQTLLSFVDYTAEPAESHALERSYYEIWL